MERPSKISFVILTWNSSAYINACVTSIFEDLGETDFKPEIFVVDNGSTDGTVEILNQLKDQYPDEIFPIFLDRNYGTTYTRNLALKEATGDYICILDSDIEIKTGTLAHLIQCMDENRITGIVAPKLVYPNGKIQKSTDQFPTLFRKLERYFMLKKIEAREQDGPEPGANQLVDYAISAFWLFPASLLDSVTGLDERFFYAPEDVDFCYRVWQSGHQVMFCPGGSAIHHTQELSRGFRVNWAMIQHLKGLAAYFMKHGYIFRRPRR